ncbi:MAG: M23 family metallopeptidase [Bacteroidota bacterium]|nr:M23 family metallopeptidase [Bacteroidota bacterium]
MIKNVLLAFLFCSNAAIAQSIAYPKNYFISPMDVPLDLSGNFGELRPNHFHTGIDITTHGAEGISVKAAADGYVSRIKIGPWGYGRVLYVTHPNGYTTVYGHLSRFNSTMAAFAKNYQYSKENFEIDIVLSAENFPVKQGEIIAYSGNTGSSGGPHLHFEIRDAKTEEALNPLLFGFAVKDNVAPVAVTLVIIPADNNATINGVNVVKKITLKQSGSTYVFANAAESITVFGKVGFAIEAYDKETNPTGKNGVYGIRLACDGQTIYSHHLERIPFDKSRFINCFINYEEHEKHNRFYQQSFLLPNNQLPVYDTTVNNGYCFFPTDMVHQFKYTLFDAYGNAATVNFKVKSLSKSPVVSAAKPYVPFFRVLAWDTTNVIEANEFLLETPHEAFYKNEIFNYTVDPAKGKVYSAKINFDELIPMQKACTLTVYANVPDSLKSKSLLARINKNGGRAAVGGKWNVNGVTAEIKEFASYIVTVDTTAPHITPANFDLKGAKQSSFATMKSIQFKMSDNFSGIGSFNAFIDGKWVLMEYEPKKNLIWYTFDEHCEKGKHNLVIKVTDKVGNFIVYEKAFVR